MIKKQLQKYIIPNIFAMIGVSFYILADTFFISIAEGTAGITALNIALPAYGIIYAIGSMIGVGSATQYSLWKSINRKGYDRFFSNSIFWTVLVSLPFLAAGIFAPAQVLHLLGADDEITSVGLTYMRIVLCFAPFFMANYTFTSFVRNDGAPKKAMAATLLSGLFNIVFDYVFMFPLGMGMPGAALATGLSPVVSMLICLTHYLSKRNTIRFKLCVPSAKMLIHSCSLGISAFVAEISNAVTALVFNFILLDIAGNVAVAAYSIAANCALIGTALFNGVSQGLQPMASTAHGNNDADAEKFICRYSLKIGAITAAALVALVWIFTNTVIGIFNSESSAELAEYAYTGIRLYFLGFLAAFINIIRGGFYSAAGYAAKSAVIAVSRGVAAIAFFAFVMSRLFGVTGVWLAFPASEVFTFLITEVMNRIGLRKAASEAED